MYVLIFLKGLLFGLMASIPLGPIGILVIQRTLSKGRRSGIISGLGAATADTILAIIAALGITIIIDFIEAQKDYLQFFGGIIILILGYKTFYSDPVKQMRKKNSKYTDWHGDFLSVLALTLSNPIAVFLFLAIFAGVNIIQDEQNYILQVILIFGITIGSLIWWTCLSYVINLYRDKIRLKNLYWINKITGIIITLFGIAAMIAVAISKYSVIYQSIIK